MKKCCCCIPLNAGAIILVLLSLIITAIQLCVLVPYLANVDPESFNLIEKYKPKVMEFLQSKLTEYKVSEDVIQQIKETINNSLWPTVLSKYIFNRS